MNECISDALPSHSEVGRKHILCIALGLAAIFAAPLQLKGQTVSACSGVVSGESAKITGRILDPSAGAVQGATVTLECGAVSHETTTDSDGYYSFDVQPGSYNLHINKNGFDRNITQVTVSSAQTLTNEDIRLSLANAAEAVTVTAGGFEQLVVDAPASVSVLTREELQTKRVQDLAQALIDVEGVDVGQNVGKTGGMTISMRGMPSEYTLFLIDGKRQNSAGSVTPNGFGETATSFMPPVAAIERIEVVRGPMSTLYGSDAMGGVVNIITRKVSEKWSGSINVNGTLQQNRSYGDTGQGTFYLTGPVWSDRIGLALRGSAFRREPAALKYENVNGELVPITSFGMSPTNSDIFNLGGRVSIVANKQNDFYVDYDNMTQNYNNKDRQLGTVGLQGGYADYMKFRRNQLLLSHQGRYRYGILDTSLTRNTTDTLGRTIPPGTPGRTPGDPRTLEATNTILDSKFVAPITTRHMLSVGGQWWNAHMIDAVAPNPYNHKQGALFAEDEWRALRQLTFTGGIRYDHHNTFGSNISPRGYVVYRPFQILSVKGGVSRGFRTPQLNQLATGIVGFGAQGTLPLIGSPGLKPETSTSTEVSTTLLLNGLSFSTTLFNNEFQNKIASGPGLPNCSFAGSPNRTGCVDFGPWPNVDLFGQSINVDEAITRGVEASMRYRFLRKWEVMNNYTFTKSEQRSGSQMGQPLVNTPKHMYNSTIRFAATQKLNTWLRIEARSNRTRGNGATQEAATAAMGPYKGYGLVHLGAGYQISKQISISGTIYNLLGTDFLTYAPYVYNGTTSYANHYNILQEPRRFWLSVTYNF